MGARKSKPQNSKADVKQDAFDQNLIQLQAELKAQQAEQEQQLSMLDYELELQKKLDGIGLQEGDMLDDPKELGAPDDENLEIDEGELAELEGEFLALEADLEQQASKEVEKQIEEKQTLEQGLE